MERIGSGEPGWKERALSHLRGGCVLAVPTETVYGLAAMLHRPEGVGAIHAWKGRPEESALPWQVGDLETALDAGFAFTPGALALGRVLWPGPLTMVLPRPGGCPAWFAPGLGTVALRVPDHEVIRALLEALRAPLAVTSANRTGSPPARSAGEVEALLGSAEGFALLTGGPPPSGTASTVVDATGEVPSLVRAGPIPMGRVLEVWHGGA